MAIFSVIFAPVFSAIRVRQVSGKFQTCILRKKELECGPMPNVMADLPNIGSALCSMKQSLADAHY